MVVDALWQSEEDALGKVVTIYLAIIVMFAFIGMFFSQWVLLQKRIELTEENDRSLDLEQGCPCDNRDGPRCTAEPDCPRARSFPQKADFPGNPASLDRMTRLIRCTCKLGLARTPGKCTLCGQDIYESDYVRTLPCGHRYHNPCILQLLLVTRCGCPDCDEPLF